MTRARATALAPWPNQVDPTKKRFFFFLPHYNFSSLQLYILYIIAKHFLACLFFHCFGWSNSVWWFWTVIFFFLIIWYLINMHASGGCFVELLWKMGEDLRISLWAMILYGPGHVTSRLRHQVRQNNHWWPLTFFFIHDTPWEEGGCVSRRSAPVCPVPHSQHSLLQSKPKYFSHAVLSNGVRCHDIPELAPWTIYVTQADCSTPPDAQ